MVPGRVAVLLSTYNRAATVSRAIESVLAQQEVALEVVIIDDHSSDNTTQILARWQSDDRVRCFRNAHNLGLPSSLNYAASLADSEFLARIDDDDYWTDKHKLKKQLDWMNQHAAGVILGTAYVDEQGRATENPLSDAQIRSQMLFRCPFCHSSVLMRRTAFDAVNGYDETLSYAEDWDLWLRLGTRGVMGNLADSTLVKEPGENNLSQRFFHRQLKMAQGFVARYGDEYPGAARAGVLHRFNLLFFRLVPVNGKLHRGMGKVFRRVFQLGSSERNGNF